MDAAVSPSRRQQRQSAHRWRPPGRSAVGNERALIPGGVALIGHGESQQRIEKLRPEAMGEWTYQWSAPHGGLVSEDRTVGVPPGVQWIGGPLFAMAGRKSSTQSLVSAGGHTTQTIEGMADKNSQRVAWNVVGKPRPIMETGIANLTVDTAPAPVHFADGQTQQWLMVRLEDPSTDAGPSGTAIQP